MAVVHHQTRLTGRPARASALLSAAALSLTALTGCSVAKKPTPTLAQLRADPVTALQYPASELVNDGGADSNNAFGANAAFLDRTWVTKDQSSAVLAFFDGKLQSMGWTRDDSAGVGTTSWAHTAAWRSGKRTYEVGIDTPEQAARVMKNSPKVTAADTVFETLQE